jgi:hypothetical protein
LSSSLDRLREGAVSLEVAPITACTGSSTQSPIDLHNQFLALLPRIETHARIYFRGIKCADQRADKIRETVALAWKEYRRLIERGKDVTQFAMVFISLVARGVRCGRA